MGQILIKYENKLTKPDVIVSLNDTSKNEAGEYCPINKYDVQQTSLYGIEAPIIQIGNVFVDPTEIKEFELKSVNQLPEIYVVVLDRNDNLKRLQTPGLDNEMVIEILPPFDNAYKKIKLVFYISKFTISNNSCIISGTYKSSELLSSKFECFGCISTYQLFDTIAKNTNLGFATNVDDDTTDSRYIYCDHKSYMEILQNEINRANSNQTCIYDWWVDLWDNINLVNIYERYNTIDKKEDMMIWVAGQGKDVSVGVDVIPHQVPAVLNNHPADSQMDLFVFSYVKENNTGLSINGTDKIYSIYSEDNKEYVDYLLQDGDVKNDIFYKYDYAGEYYGDYNYILAEKSRDFFIQKMGIQQVRVRLQSPMLSLMRGKKVNLVIYYNNSGVKEYEDKLKDAGIYNDNPDTQIPLQEQLSDYDKNRYNPTDGEFLIDKSISGQYMIKCTIIKYYNNSWTTELLLARPSSTIPKLINDKR